MLDQASLRRMVAGTNRHSPVFEWLDLRYLDLMDASSGGARISWGELAAHMAANGIMDGHGKPPSRSRLALTWQVVKNSRSQKPRRRRSAQTPLDPGEGSAPPASAVVPVLVETRKEAPSAEVVPVLAISAPSPVPRAQAFKPGPAKPPPLEDQVALLRDTLNETDRWVGNLSAADKARQNRA
jgi:hypothetical protein